MENPDKVMSEQAFMMLSPTERQAILRDVERGERRGATARRNAAPAAQAARARYAASFKGRAARAAAYQRGKARRLAAERAARQTVLGDFA